MSPSLAQVLSEVTRELCQPLGFIARQFQKTSRTADHGHDPAQRGMKDHSAPQQQ